MMRILVRAIYLSVFFLSAQFSVSAELLKFGFISTEKVYREAKVSKTAQQRLDKEFSEKQSALKKMQQEASTIQKQLSNQHLDASARSKLENDLATLNDRYKSQARLLTEEYTMRRNEEFAGIQERANHLIKEIAQKEGYDLILQEAVYVDPKHDLTQKLINLLDQ